MKRAIRDEYVVRIFHTILSRSIRWRSFIRMRKKERESLMIEGIIFGIFDKLEGYEIPVINK